MTLRQYTTFRIIIAMCLSAFIASSVVRHEYFWPVVAMVIAMIVLLALRSRVKEVLADERDYAIGGRAARWAMQIFSLAAVALMFLFLWKGEQDPQMTVVAHVLAYAVCALMLLYSLLFRLIQRYGVRAP
ncbi:MAG: DUF2178 domain-containing protein [Candidatus Peribacteraceae bacterium]|nr:DUF2178 domain-containing protein [Candidatus Peribacteraceae bacterium]MDD5741815.1 DUF2178 domain-containing protein [Candidatus Peribacteraceae bacterium]